MKKSEALKELSSFIKEVFPSMPEDAAYVILEFIEHDLKMLAPSSESTLATWNPDTVQVILENRWEPEVK